MLPPPPPQLLIPTLNNYHQTTGRVMKDQLHRRRIRTEEKAKVVAAVWRKEFIQFLAALAVLLRTIIKTLF